MLGDLHQGLCLPSPFLSITLYHLLCSFYDYESYFISYSFSLYIFIQTYFLCHPDGPSLPVHYPPHHLGDKKTIGEANLSLSGSLDWIFQGQEGASSPSKRGPNHHISNMRNSLNDLKFPCLRQIALNKASCLLKMP